MKVHLIDGTFELFRCAMAAPAFRSAAGQEVGAVRGLVHTLTALLRGEDVTHVAVAFDTVVDVPIDLSRAEPPWGQHQLAADVARALGLVIWPMVRRYEADDALATGAARFAEEPDVEQILLCTRDKDLAQCVRGDHVVMLDRVNDTIQAETDVVARWGVAPRLIPSLLALVGDKADGLPGIPGWGIKSAAAMLRRYGSIEDIPRDAANWDVALRGAARLAETLAARRGEALLYRELITLATDVPLAEGLDDLEWRGAHRAALTTLCAEIGAEDVLSRVPRWT